MVSDFHVAFNHLVEVKRIYSAGDRESQRIANKVPGVMVFEKLRILFENLAFFRFFDVGFHRHQPFFAGFVQDFEIHLERIEIELLGKAGWLQQTQNAAHDLAQDVRRICNQHGTDRRAADDDEFCRLNEHCKLAVLHEVASGNCADYDDDSYDDEHVLPFSSTGCMRAPALQPRNHSVKGVERLEHRGLHYDVRHNLISPPGDGAAIRQSCQPRSQSRITGAGRVRNKHEELAAGPGSEKMGHRNRMSQSLRNGSEYRSYHLPSASTSELIQALHFNEKDA